MEVNESESAEIIEDIDGLDDLDESVLEEPAQPVAPAEEEQESPETEEPEAEAEDVEAEAPDADSEEPPAATEAVQAEEYAPGSMESLQAQVEALQGLLRKMAGNQPIIDVPAPEGEPTQGAVSGQTLAEFTAQQVPPQQGQTAPQAVDISEEEYDAIMSDPAKFSAYMRAEREAWQREAVQEAYALAMQQLPGAILPTVYEASQTQMTVQNWAQSNPIINENREMAATILNQVDGANPQLPLEKKLELTGAWMNQVFGKPQNKPGSPSVGAQTPAFAKPPRGARPAAATVDALQAEMDELSL